MNSTKTYNSMTLHDRVEKSIVKLYNYMKHNNTISDKQQTGEGFFLNKCPNLMVIEIVFNECFSVDSLSKIHKQILNSVDNNYYVVMNEIGNLQIYCNVGDFPKHL